MRLALFVLAALTLSGCELIYKLPTRQGNVIEQKEIDKLELGMSREQVQFVLGTPLAASPLRADRWDYFGYYKSPRGKVFSRTVTLWFESDKLARIDGQQAPADEAAKPDLEAIEAEKRKASTEAERSGEKTDAGIVITPENK